MILRRSILLVLFTTISAFAQPDAELPDTSHGQAIDTAVFEIDVPSADSALQLEKEPVLTTFVKADYPTSLQKTGILGTVLLTLLISEKGTVDSVGIVRGCHPQLDSCAKSAAHRFVFTPAQAQGAPVAVLLEYAYRFTLDEALAANDTSINFAGTLLEKGTRLPIADAVVAIEFEDTLSDTTLPVQFSTYLTTIGNYSGQSMEAQRLLATTDSLGRFSFRALPGCSILVVCIIPGYEQFWQREIIARGLLLSVTYHPQRESYSEYEVIVYGKTEEQAVSRRQLSKNEVKRIPGVGGDAVKVVQAMPGVGRPTMGNGDIIVRGSRPWDSGYFLNGLRIPQLYHFGGIKSTYNAEALDGVNFYPGGTGVRHGGYTGGIVELLPRKARNDRFHGLAELNAMDLQLSLEGPVTKNIAVLLSARRSFFGEAIAGLFEKLDEWGENPPMWLLPFYWDFLARVDVRINESQSLTVSAFGSRDSLSVVFNNRRSGSTAATAAERANMAMSFTMLAADWKWDIAPSIKNSLQYGLTFDKQGMAIFGDIKTMRRGVMHQINDELSLKLSDKITLYPGVDVLLNPLDFSMMQPDGTGIVRSDTMNDWLFGVAGAYLFSEFKATEKLTVFPGIRFDYFPELSYCGSLLPQFGPYGKNAPTWRRAGEPSLRMAAQYKINDHHTARAAFGTYSQTPQPVGWVIHPTWGEPSLPSTKAAQYVIGYLWNLTDLLSVDVQAYTNYQWDIPGLDTSEVSTTGKRTWVADVEGRMFGMELMIRYLNGKHFFGWLAYTLSRSERRSPSVPEWVLFEEDIPHYLQLVGGVHLPLDWDAGVRLQYATGKPQTPVVGRHLYENSQVFIPHYGESLSERTGPYFTLGLRFEKLRVKKHFSYSLFLDLPDLLGTFYASPEFYIYNYDYTERKAFSMIPMIMAGLRVEY